MKIAKDSTTFEEHLDKRYGKTGTSERNEFERNVKAFIIGELIREARLSAKLTQEQLAQKSGTKKATFRVSRTDKAIFS